MSEGRDRQTDKERTEGRGQRIVRTARLAPQQRGYNNELAIMQRVVRACIHTRLDRHREPVVL